MALAYLKYRSSADGKHYFLADIGTSRFFQFKIGHSKRRLNGLDLVDEETYESPILQLEANPLPGQGKFLLAVEQTQFSARPSGIQLWSYRSASQQSPALSEVVEVSGHTSAAWNMGNQFSLTHSTVMTNSTIHRQHKAFSCRERKVSEAMFWDQLLSALPRLVEQGLPLIRGLIGGTGGGRSANDILNTVADMIRQVTQTTAPAGARTAASGTAPATGGTATTSPTPPATAPAPVAQQSLSFSLQQIANRTISRDTYEIIQDDPEKLGKMLNDSILRLSNRPKAQYQYSEAKIAPAIGAIVSAVAPYIKDILNLGNAAEQNRQQHLEHLVALLNNPNIVPLLESMSLGAGTAMRFIPSNKIQIDTSHLQKINLQSKQRVVFSNRQSIVLPIRLASTLPEAASKPLSRAILNVCIQKTSNYKVVLEKRFPLQNVHINSIINDIVLSVDEVNMLPLNCDLKVEFTLRWKSKKSQKVFGSVKNQFITVMGDYIFDQIGGKVGESIPLNDIVKHRALWHKIWEGGYAQNSRWNLNMNVKYFHTLNLRRDETALMQTERMVLEDNATDAEREPSRRVVRAKLRSGMQLSLDMVNSMLPYFNLPLLDPVKLRGLKSVEFRKFYNQIAQLNVEFKGKQEDIASLWAYPEIGLYQVTLLKASEINEFGQVVKTESEVIQFPRPTTIRFIGTKTE